MRAATNVVTIEDAYVDHRVALDLEHEHRVVPNELDRQGIDLIDVLFRQNGGAGSDTPHLGHVPNRSTV
jgi:hypothetical protein